MNVPDADSLPPEPAADDASSAAPKRKRAPRKTAADKAQPALAAEDGQAQTGAATPSADAAPAQAETAEAPAPRKPRTRTKAAVVEESPAAVAAVPAGAEAPARGDDPVRAEGETRQGEGRAEGNAPEAGNGSEAPGEPGSRSARRNRNRRRGRRGADKRAEGQVEGNAGANGGANNGAKGGANVSSPAALAPALAGELFAELLAGRFDADADAENEDDVTSESAPAGHGDDRAMTAFNPAEDSEGQEADSAPSADDGQPQPAAASVVAEHAAPTSGTDAASKRVLSPEPDAPKLHKVLAQSGLGSRRDLEQKITEGRVTVNGEVAHTGQRISYGDRIAIDGKPVRVRIAPPPARVLAYHKPAGEVVTHDDPQQRPTVFRRLPRLQQGKWQSVGRLDINTEGLLLFTNSGELANQLMHPRFGVEREYAVRSLGTLAPEAKARLLEGVEIDGQPCNFKSIEDGGGEGVNHWYRCVITEGRNREVRKLFDAVGHAVSRLIRIRYGSVVLPRGLKRGVWVDLQEGDLRTLRGLASQAVPRPERPERNDRVNGEGPPAAGPREGRDGGREGRDGRGPRKRRGGRGKGDAAALPQGAPQAPALLDDMPPGFIPDPLQTSLPGLSPKRQRPPRGDRLDGGPRVARGPRAERGEGGEQGDSGPIPNPLQQTFDKRAIQQERALKRDLPEDGPIPNPLQQTYDKRALMRDRMPQRDIPDDGPIPNPLQQTYDKRFASGNGGSGFGGGGSKGGQGGPRGKRGGPGAAGGQGQARGKARGGAAKKTAGGGAGREPDPMQTSVGYIGGDAFLRKGAGGRGPRSGGGGGGPRGGGGGGGGPRGPAKPGGSKGGPRGGGGGGNRGGRPK